MSRRLVAGVILVAVATVAAAGCNTVQPERKLDTQVVKVGVAVGCVRPAQDPGPPGVYADQGLPREPTAADERYRRIAQANEQRKARLAKLEPVLTACR